MNTTNQPQIGSAGVVAVTNFLTATTSIDLEDAYEDLIGLGVESITQVHTQADGQVLTVTLAIDDLFAVFWPVFLERELDLMCALLMQLEGAPQ